MLQLVTLLFVMLTAWYGISSSTNTVQVKVEGGIISGADVGGGVRAYKGIPFAAPPLGGLRWKEPQPVVPWSGTRRADAFAPPCMQLSRANGEPSEDCLYLNVWTAGGAGERRPVMAWIHGGGLVGGATAEPRYDGREWAKRGVVAVTIGYRLGPFGYLAHPQLTAESPHRSSGNYGTLDQIAALQWVQRNVSVFGGDPTNVTILGESAGSWSVNVLIASPLAKGLFARAVGQSGGRFYRDWATNASLTNPMYLNGGPNGALTGEQAGVAFATLLGADSVTKLRAMPAAKIISVPQFDFRRLAEPTPPDGTRGFFTLEKVDGWLLPTDVRTIFEGQRQNRMSVIVGSNNNEFNSIITAPDVPTTLAGYRRRIEWQYGDMVEEFDALYPVRTDADILKAMRDSASDHDFTLQMRTWARMTTVVGQGAYLYQFSHVPPNPRDGLGAYHAGEIEYVFKNLVNPWPYTEVDRRLADAMASYWTSFAKSGSPNGSQVPRWKPYDLTSEPYMEFGDSPAMAEHLKKQRLDFQQRWSERYPAGFAISRSTRPGAQ
jgi:para-nitrobenzyl esterase